MVPDVTGRDVYPILDAVSEQYGFMPIVLLTCAIAESRLDPTAFRDNGPDDTSVGPYQQVIKYASGYGVGDGTYSPANVALCKQVFNDWEKASDIAAQHLGQGLTMATGAGLVGDDAILGAMCVYNAGHFVPLGGWWWSSQQHASYVLALNQAKQKLGE